MMVSEIVDEFDLAGNPDKSWEDILPELQAANLSPVSIEAIARYSYQISPLFGNATRTNQS
ncbi:MAG: hypothetical protein QNJ63_09715 [Calothrix sp. MO_192.B10]|nr:hypothetical protein [Calothrix sp. MO_192.B10]